MGFESLRFGGAKSRDPQSEIQDPSYPTPAPKHHPKKDEKKCSTIVEMELEGPSATQLDASPFNYERGYYDDLVEAYIQDVITPKRDPSTQKLFDSL